MSLKKACLIVKANNSHVGRLRLPTLIGWLLLNIVFLEAIRPIELNFHMKTPYDKLAKNYTFFSGHTSKMADMSIYGETNLKIFFSRTRIPMTLGLGM